MPIPILNYTPQPVPETKYNIVVVAQEYDGFADFPDRPIQLATANAIAGTGVIPGFDSEHAATMLADLSQVPQKNITTTVNSQGGVTTSYLVPTRTWRCCSPCVIWGCPNPSSTPSTRR